MSKVYRFLYYFTITIVYVVLIWFEGITYPDYIPGNLYQTCLASPGSRGCYSCQQAGSYLEENKDSKTYRDSPFVLSESISRNPEKVELATTCMICESISTFGFYSNIPSECVNEDKQLSSIIDRRELHQAYYGTIESPSVLIYFPLLVYIYSLFSLIIKKSISYYKTQSFGNDKHLAQTVFWSGAVLMFNYRYLNRWLPDDALGVMLLVNLVGVLILMTLSLISQSNKKDTLKVPNVEKSITKQQRQSMYVLLEFITLPLKLIVIIYPFKWSIFSLTQNHQEPLLINYLIGSFIVLSFVDLLIKASKIVARYKQFPMRLYEKRHWSRVDNKRILSTRFK